MLLFLLGVVLLALEAVADEILSSFFEFAESAIRGDLEPQGSATIPKIYGDLDSDSPLIISTETPAKTTPETFWPRAYRLVVYLIKGALWLE